MNAPAPQAATKAYHDDQLVVALSHLSAVEQQLAVWGVAVELADSDARLGLGVLVGDFRPALAPIREAFPAVFADLPAEIATDRGLLSLEIVLRGLRAAFRKTWNWEPTIGKNRRLRDVSGRYEVGIGGVSAFYEVGIGSDTQAFYEVGIGGDAHAHYEVGIGSDPQSVDGAAFGFGPRTGDAGARATVAIVDTGILPNPWLAGSYRCAAGAVITDEDELAQAAHHGTFVAGLVLREAPAAQLWIERSLDGTGYRDSWDLAKDLARLGERQVDIVNLSLGCFTEDDRPPLVLQRAMDCLGPQTVVVAAAGNFHLPAGARPRPLWPAALESVVAVGSVADDGNPSFFSPSAPWIDVRARGEQVVSTYGGVSGKAPDFSRWNGTSFAAATVSGYLAAQLRPGESATQAWRRLAAAGTHGIRFGE